MANKQRAYELGPILAWAVANTKRPVSVHEPSGHVSLEHLPREVVSISIHASVDGEDELWQPTFGGWVMPIERTLERLPIRYRKPYCARHSSVSWNLMVGRNPLWVAKQHGHSIPTMLRVYAAWTDGATDTDIEAIQRAMASKENAQSAVATGFATGHGRERGKCSKRRIKSGGERGIRIRPAVGSESYEFGKRFGPRRSPEIPVAVTKAVTSNPSLSGTA